MADDVKSKLKSTDDRKCVKCHKFIRKTIGVSKVITTNEEASEFLKDYGFCVPIDGVICYSCRSALRLAKMKKKQSKSDESEEPRGLEERPTKSDNSAGMLFTGTTDSESMHCASKDSNIETRELVSSSFMLDDATYEENLKPVKKKAKIINDTKCVSCNEFIRKTQGTVQTIQTREEALHLTTVLGSYTQIGEVICSRCRSKLRLDKSTKERSELVEKKEMIDLQQNMVNITVTESSHDNEGNDSSPHTDVIAPSNSEVQSQSQSSLNQQTWESQSTTTPSQTCSNPSDSTYYDSDKESSETIELPYPRTTCSHAYCFICGQRNVNEIQDVPLSARIQAFVAVRIFIPRRNRCCQKHLIKNRFYIEELDKIPIASGVSSIEVNEVRKFLDTLSEKNDGTLHRKIGEQTLSDERIKALTGYSWDNIRQIEPMMKNMRSSTNRNVSQALIIFLMKLRTANSNNCIAAILEIEESTVTNAINTVLNCFEAEILPKNFGLGAYNRNFLIEQSSAVARKLYDLEDRLALICDGTYLRHEKSSNNAYQRKSYSGQKHTHLCKPFTVATTNGFVVEVAGPYTGNMNDAKILKEIMNDPEGLPKILKPGDIFILDRGFRDVVDFLKSKGYKVFMPALKGKRNQLTTEESNASRLVTKVRWVVEAVHGIIGQKSKLLHHQFSNKILPHAKTYCKVACYLYNVFCKRLSSDDEMIDSVIERINVTKESKNTLAEHVEQNNWNRKTVIFSKVSSKDLHDFPEMTINDLKLFFTGSYQLSQAVSYLAEILKDDDTLDLDFCKSEPNIVRFEVRSRHINSKTYKCYVHYQPNAIGHSGIKRYCCNCANGNRTVGCCSHVAAIVYYLTHARYLSRIVRPAQQLAKLFDPNEVCPVINEDSDDD